MVKKVVALILSTILVFTFAACGDNEASQKPQKSGTKGSQDSGLEGGLASNVENVDGKTDNDDELETFSETITFVGFDFSYPEGIYFDNFMYGYTFRYENDVAVLLEAPSIAAEMVEIADINDAATAVEEYVIETLETRTRDLFSPSSTTQTITTSEVKTINDIEMLRVEGFFTNTRQEVDVPFVGYYFLNKNDHPVYFVGVPLNEETSVDSFMDEFAGYVEPMKQQ